MRRTSSTSSTTATLSDLRPHCLRHQLLKYCSDPHVVTPDVGGLDVSELERVARQADRQRVRPPIRFGSWFEVDVFLRIARRRYRVIPQFEVAGYRIDLVVQGMEGSLAVECDGDAWHGADRYDADAARQRDLERCGWTFWRVRESVFRLDPDEALTNLWETLKAQRILPTAAEEAPGGVAGRPSAPSPVGDDQSASRGHASGVQVQRGADVAGERDLGLSDQLRVKPSDPPSTDEAGVSDRPPEASAAADPNERSPQQQGQDPSPADPAATAGADRCR